MNHVRVTAHLRGAFAEPSYPIHLDALVIWAESQRIGAPPIISGNIEVPETPIVTGPGDVPLASAAEYKILQRGRRYVHRRHPIPESFERARIKSPSMTPKNGPTKSLRRPESLVYPTDGILVWFASVRDTSWLRDLLQCITHVGRLTGHGYGKVQKWEVVDVDPWEGFPLLRDRYPLRVLPKSHAGVAGDARQGIACPRPPYWDRGRQCECYVPGGPC